MRISIRNNRAGARVSGGQRTGRTGAGFTLLETIVAMLILMIGLLGLASALSFSLAVSNRGRNVTNTKLLIASVLEQMETLRNTKQLTFCQIANASPNGLNCPTDPGAPVFNGFPTGPQDVSINPGPDGIYGTGDDLLDTTGNGSYFTNPALAVKGYTREIEITNLSPTLKRIKVKLNITGGSNSDIRSLVGISYLNDNAMSNFTP